MLKRLSITLTLLFALCLFVPSISAQKGGRGGGKSSSSKSSSKTSSKSEKTVHVRGYTKKDGTVVAPYDRAAPGSKTDAYPASTSSSSTSSRLTDRGWCDTCPRDKHGRIKRSKEATRAFERIQPCPSTGLTSGKCPGYVIDHVIPLANGGADDPSNMQWQTKEAAKAKDKIERRKP
jgi:hypothetical protein